MVPFMSILAPQAFLILAIIGLGPRPARTRVHQELKALRWIPDLELSGVEVVLFVVHLLLLAFVVTE